MEKLNVGHSSEREKKMKEKINEIVDHINWDVENRSSENFKYEEEKKEYTKEELLRMYKEKFGKNVPWFKHYDHQWILNKLNQ